ncbi:FAD/NAD(P)-binding domain-containing protein [Violaceomyces palustris]|uniref:FAD/NAD(P)-binding domain-containing protein n=1 Tax=Violaceomyces palustris TaxID=1673888 RepID=A0ACD0P6U0_9BASI|nr:FAD/NAD(P)-binding domain-containing protein [Violaceomyces palustris]
MISPLTDLRTLLSNLAPHIPFQLPSLASIPALKGASPTPTRALSIGIIGAGLGGLTAAVVLQKAGIHVTVYERDSASDARSQGGILDMHPESGQVALAAAGLTDQFEKICMHELQTMRIVDKEAKIAFDEIEFNNKKGRPNDEDRPEVERTQLRQILLDALLPETVRWGTKLVDLEVAQGHALVHLEGQSQPWRHDVVVGADGAWSKVRSFLSGAKPDYTGVVFVETFISPVSEAQAAITGKGSMFALSDDRGLIVQRTARGQLRVYITLRKTLDEVEALKQVPLVQLKEKLLDHFQGWNPVLLSLIQDSDPEKLVVRPLFSLSAEHRWSSNPHVTLLGDAAHVMVPFAGEGANLAMLDALEVARAIIIATRAGGSNESFAKQLALYEGHMMKRASIASEESLKNQDVFISQEAPQNVVDLLHKLMG